MKKYVFRLESVRRVRNVEQDLAKAALLQANSEVQRAIQAVEARTEEFEASNSQLTGTGSIESFMKQRYFNELAGKAVIVAQASARAAELEAAAKRDLWSEAAKRVKALDNLNARRREEHTLEAQRDEIREIDDIVTGRYARRSG